MRKAGDKPLEYVKIKMNDVLIAGVDMHIGDGESLVMEMRLNFAEYSIEYTPQQADGTGGAAIEAGFNIAKNTKV